MPSVVELVHSAPMPLPKYCKHKASGQAYVTLGGRERYLGRYGTPESHEMYERLIAEWLANGKRMPAQSGALTVGQIVNRYLTRSKRLFGGRRDGSSSYTNRRDALHHLFLLYSTLPAPAFGIMELRAVRSAMERAVSRQRRKPDAEPRRLSRDTINRRITMIVKMFRWAAGEGFVPAELPVALAVLEPLVRGETEARETPGGGPVASMRHVAATLSRVRPAVAAMIRVQYRTAMRPGEVVQMRVIDLDMRQDVWLYTPATHKNQWRGKRRVIPIGPRAQRVLQPLLTEVEISAPLFQTHTGSAYAVMSYGNAIRRACDALKVPRWTPNQLRHTAATRIRDRFDVESAAAILGHARVETTEIYTAKSIARAVETARLIG